VEEVTWHDCVAFAAKLCEKEGLRKGTYRLPHEREWEYACRAGTDAPYHCGAADMTPIQLRDHLEGYADFRWNNGSGPRPVGSRLANAWGIHDMHGNVWEWCSNYFYFYGSNRRDSLQRSIRGGNWRTKATDSRSASRFRLPPDSLGNICGLRILRVIPRSVLAPPAPPAPGDGPAEDASTPGPAAGDAAANGAGTEVPPAPAP
jgi:formylglycine-generating enzyme required for sulfatase activity